MTRDVTEPRCTHSPTSDGPIHGKYLENVADSFVYIFVGADLVLAYPMCADHKVLWWESDAYRTRRSPIPLHEVPLPRPRSKRRRQSVDTRIRKVLARMVAEGMLPPERVPGYDKKAGPLPESTRDYYYQLEESGHIPDRFLMET